MAKSQQTFNKSEKEKKRLKKREDKRKKMEARKAAAKENGKKGIEFAYVDHNGHLTDTPPDPSKKIKVDKKKQLCPSLFVKEFPKKIKLAIFVSKKISEKKFPRKTFSEKKFRKKNQKNSKKLRFSPQMSLGTILSKKNSVKFSP